MPSTITAFTYFTSTTKALSSEVNSNFANYRGTLLPISELTATAESDSLNLGSTSYQWKDLYFGTNIYYNSEKGGGIPVGSVVPIASVSAPSNFLLCDGSSVSRSTYSDLFDVLTDGASTSPAFGFETSTNFNLPDLRGKFIRGVDSGAGNDVSATSRTAQGTGGNTGDTVGSAQGFSTENNFQTTSSLTVTHNHQAYIAGSGLQDVILGDTVTSTDVTSTSDGAHSHTVTYDNETRPINLYINYFIRY